MDCVWDSDFRDRFQTDSENGWNNSEEVIIPDLAALTDEEFGHRLNAMKQEHQKMLQLCDSMGFRPSSESEQPPRPSMPVAHVNRDYTLTTGNYQGSAGDLITSAGMDLRRPFKASPAPPRRKPPAHDNVRKREKPETDRRAFENAQLPSPSNLNEMKAFMVERYLSAYDNSEYKWDDTCSWGVDNKTPPKPFRVRSGSWSQENVANDGWRNKLTVPKPFKMTVRESGKNVTMSRSMMEFNRRQEEELRKEMAECGKKFKASPAPAHIYVPLYKELAEDQERKRYVNHMRRKKEIEDTQQPFAFLHREDQRRADKSRRQALFAVADACVPDANFKAKPFPKHIFSPDAYRKIQEQEEARQENRLARSEALLEISSLPPNMTKKRPSHQCDMSHDVDDDDGVFNRRETNDSYEDFHGPATTSMHQFEDEPLTVVKLDTDHKQRRVDRWPSHSVRSNPLSRSMSDLLSSCQREEHIVASGHHRKAKQLPKQRPVSTTTSMRPPSGPHRRPLPTSLQSTRAGIQSNKWRANQFALEERLRREIEEDLRNIDLTAS